MMTQGERIAALEAKIERLVDIEARLLGLEKENANQREALIRLCGYLDENFARVQRNFQRVKDGGSWFSF